LIKYAERASDRRAATSAVQTRRNGKKKTHFVVVICQYRGIGPVDIRSGSGHVIRHYECRFLAVDETADGKQTPAFYSLLLLFFCFFPFFLFFIIIFFLILLILSDP